MRNGKYNKYYTIIVFLIAAVVFIASWFKEGDDETKETTARTVTTTQNQTKTAAENGSTRGGDETEKSKTGDSTQSTAIPDSVHLESLAVIPEVDLKKIPDYISTPYAQVNDNIPYFSEEDLTTESFEYYSPLDSLNRCNVCVACIGTDLMPTEERGSIGSVKPSGWKTVKYAGLVDGNYLYNRCHLIGFQLAGENANKKNLITGTRYMNVDGMLPFENMVADYVKDTENHVLYRVSPIFEGDNLVASGVLMEAYSVEDDGEEVCFNVFCYNVQPGIEIDYATGDSRLEK